MYKPLELVSLYHMIQTDAWLLVNHTDSLTGLRENLKDRFHSGAGVGHKSFDVDDDDRKNLHTVLDQMRTWMEIHELPASLDRLNRVMEWVDDPEPSIQDIISQLNILSETIQDELQRRIFMYLPPNDADLYSNPVSLFPKSVKAFPSAQDNMVDACRCHALGQYTASVFHSMGILQYGLYALADQLKVGFQFPLSLAEWCNIIDGIDSKISQIRKLPKSQTKDDLLTFYSECAVQFRYFKDAWRNHVAHLRSPYDRDQAHSILIHVKDFMERLSDKISEKTAPSFSVAK